MNLNSTTKRILCYGDSNTWGYDPQSDGTRFSVGVRWTGLLQKKLGEEYWIIEEGLNGRTTALDQYQRVGRNGKTYLQPCLESQNPLDLIILMLGTNDLKEQFHQSPQGVAKNIEKLIQIIIKGAKDSDNNPSKIILISPAYVDESVPYADKDFKGAEEKSKQLAQYYQKVAEKYSCDFIDIAKFVSPSKHDGLHLDPDAHLKISEVLELKIREIA